MTDHEQKLLKAMSKYGGGFASHLAEAWLRADLQNAAKLRKEFGDLLACYEPFVRAHFAG